MKRLFLFVIPLILLIIIACTPQENVCNKPYIGVGNECCLDINENKICDNDEKQLNICQKPYIQIGLNCCIDGNDNSICDKDEDGMLETKLSETKSVQKPSKEVTIDWCGTGENINFDCRYGFLWKDSIEFKLKIIKTGKFVIKKLVFEQVDCEFEVPEESQRVLGFGDEIIFDIPCNISDESIDLDIDILADYYHPDRPDYATRVELRETIGGIVRDHYKTLDLSNSLAEGLVISGCEFSNDIFACTKHKIAQDKIEVRLKYLRPELVILNKIDLPFVPCYKNITSEEGRMEFGDEKTFVFSCEMRREFAKSGMEITYNEYLPKKDSKGNVIPNEYEEDMPRNRFISTGWLSGMIREE